MYNIKAEVIVVRRPGTMPSMHPFVELPTATHRLLYISDIKVNRISEGNYAQIILKSIWIMTNNFGLEYTNIKSQIQACAKLALSLRYSRNSGYVLEHSRTFENIREHFSNMMWYSTVMMCRFDLYLVMCYGSAWFNHKIILSKTKNYWSAFRSLSILVIIRCYYIQS
jgi:hypothetical protein